MQENRPVAPGLFEEQHNIGWRTYFQYMRFLPKIKRESEEMQANVLINTTGIDHWEWLNARSKGIGGSDAAAILGLNKWKSPVAVYLDKTGQAREEEIQSEAAYWGTKQEELVAQEFALRTGKKVRKRNAILQHPEYSWMLANVDRLIVGESVGLECKTASEYLKDQWKDDEVPASYLIQCQHYMAVTGFEAWWIAVLIGGNKFVYKLIERDEEIIQYLIQEEKNFWENQVLAQIPPMFDGSEASSDLLKKMYPVGEPSSETELPLEADDLIEQYLQAKSNEKDASEIVQKYENQLKSLLGDYETGTASKHLVQWKNVSSNRIDSKLLAKEQPDIFKKYSKPSVSRRFGIKSMK